MHWAGHRGANSGWGQGAQGGGHTGANREDRSASPRETDLRVNVANCFTKSRPAALAPLAGERIVSDAPRSDWPAGRFVSPSPARPPSPHWPANELFQTLRAPIGRPTNCFRRSIFGLEQYLKTAIFHTIFTHC